MVGIGALSMAGILLDFSDSGYIAFLEEMAEARDSIMTLE